MTYKYLLQVVLGGKLSPRRGRQQQLARRRECGVFKDRDLPSTT